MGEAVRSMGRGQGGNWRGGEGLRETRSEQSGWERVGKCWEGPGRHKWAWKGSHSPKLEGCKRGSALFPFMTWRELTSEKKRRTLRSCVY